MLAQLSGDRSWLKVKVDPTLPNDTIKMGDATLTNIKEAGFDQTVLVGNDAPEIVHIPKGSSVYPTDYFQRIEQLWRIAQEVAEKESEYGRGLDFEDRFTVYYCPFCESEMPASDYASGEPFPHESLCIVTIARALVEQRKQLPKIVLETKKEGEE